MGTARASVAGSASSCPTCSCRVSNLNCSFLFPLFSHILSIFLIKNRGFSKAPGQTAHAHCLGAYCRRGRKQAKAPGHGICPGETHSAATHHGIPKGNVSRGHFLRLLTFWSFNLMGISYAHKPILSMGLWAFLRKIFPCLRGNRFIKQEKRA